MGDDLLDLPVLARVGLSAAPADAVDEVLARVHWQSRFAGGRGAVRELVEVVLRARGGWDALVRSYCVAMQGYLVLLASLVALLFGLAAGKAWERYKLVEGRWIDRRRVRQSPFFILGLNHLVAGQVDLAIEALEKASGLDPGALELRLVLGNLYREKGQVGRAIGEHQSLLQRPRLNRIEQANVLLCLGLDYRRGGFVDRAVATFADVLKLDPNNEAALLNLEKLQEDQHQWQEAYVTRLRLARLPDQPNSQSILAFLETELGMQAMKQDDLAEATKRFEAAMEADPTVIPAYLNLGEVLSRQGDLAGAAAIWERAINVSPDRSYLALDRLEHAYATLGAPGASPICADDSLRRPRGTGVRAWRWRGTCHPPDSPPPPWSCCSRPSSTTRMPWPSIRPSGTRCPSLACPARWSRGIST